MSLIQEALKRQQSELNTDGGKNEIPAEPTNALKLKVSGPEADELVGREPQPLSPGDEVVDSTPSPEQEPDALEPDALEPAADARQEPLPQEAATSPAGRSRLFKVAVAAGGVLVIGGLVWGGMHFTKKRPQPAPAAGSRGAVAPVAATTETNSPAKTESPTAAGSQSVSNDSAQPVVVQPPPEPAVVSPETSVVVTVPTQATQAVERTVAEKPVKVVVSAPDPAAEEEPAIPKKVVVWPSLLIKGLLSTGDGRGAAIINNEIKGIGQSIEGVKVVEVKSDSVTLEYQGESRVLRSGDDTLR